MIFISFCLSYREIIQLTNLKYEKQDLILTSKNIMSAKFFSIRMDNLFVLH